MGVEVHGGLPEARIAPEHRANGRARLLAAVLAPALLVLAAVAAVAWFADVAPGRFTMDPAVLAGAHPFLGAVSNLGVLVWTGGAAIALFAAQMLRRRAGQGERARFLLAAGLLTTWLMLDDLFMLHEWFFPDVLGVAQTLVLACYAALAGGFLLRFRGQIAQLDGLLLGLAIMFFGTSVLLDQLPEEWFRAWGWLYLFEDGCKLLGIVSWSAYFAQVSRVSLSLPGPRAVT